MRNVIRSVSIVIVTAALGLTVSLPAFAGMTKCLCNNGKVINTSRKGDSGCDSACKILGGGGRVWNPEDQQLEEDDVVVRPPRRKRGTAGPRR